MSAAREAVFAAIRRSLGVHGEDEPRRQAVAGRLAAHAPGIRPARGQGTPQERIAAFTAEAERASAGVARVASGGDAPAAVARFLGERDLPALVRRGEDARLAGLDWAGAGIEVSVGPSDGGDLCAVSHAEAAIAETGTLVVVSGPDNPTTLNFLPDVHVVVVEAAAVLANFEDFLVTARQAYGAQWPRALHFITGPSRSADIEQKLLLGAHGPRHLLVLVVGAA